MCEEKRQANDAASERTSCCGPEMEKKMRALFTGSCADRMAEMMKDCCGLITETDKPAGADKVQR